ncbi:MAG: ribonuclease E inhibitor RraB [Planctomycetes bacterium]|nr:ribonuclease E inhibitor RraB [Planctomycetota bacterium]
MTTPAPSDAGGAEPRDVLHFIFFCDAESHNGCREALAKLGFRIHYDSTAQPDFDPEESGFSLTIARPEQGSRDHTERLARELGFYAEEYGGNYDGWEYAAPA